MGQGTESGRPSRKWAILRRVLLGVVVVVALVFLLGPAVAAPFVRQRLQDMVSKNLNARLTMDSLSYRFPYGVKARNAALVATDERGQAVDLLRVKELELALTKLPFGDGPLVIERIAVREPSVHLVMNEQGLVGKTGLVRQELTVPLPPDLIVKRKERPSDYFRLRRFEVRDGSVVYEDRRGGEGAPKVVWRNLSVELDTEPTSGSLYRYEMAAKNAPLATANVRGTVDVDSLMLEVEKFVLGVKVERGRPQEQLPPLLQEILRRYEVAGGLTVDGHASVPLKEPGRAAYEVALDLPSASARVSDGGGRMDRLALKVRVSSEDRAAATREVERPVTLSAAPAEEENATTRENADEAVAGGSTAATRPTGKPKRQLAPPTVVRLDLLDVGTGDTVLHAEKGEAVIDPASQQWRVKDLLCRLDLGKDRSGLPSAIEKALGRLELSGKVRLTATAAGPLRPDPARRVMDQVEYQVVAYPRDISVKPPKWPGPFTNVSGTVRANREAVVFENVEARYREDRFFVAGARIPLENVTQELRVNEINGSMTLSGRVEDYPKPFAFTAEQLHPSGTWYAMGYFARKRGQPPGTKPDFRFDVRSDGEAGGAISPRRVPLTDVKAEVVVATKLVEVKRLDANLLGGRLTAEGQVTPGKGAELNYQGTGWARDVDLRALSTYLTKDGQPPKRLSGKANVNVQFGGTGPGPEEGRTAVDNFGAAGRFEVLEGHFWDLSVVKDVATGVKVTNEALTVGTAAGVFEVQNRVIDLRQAAVSAPVLGVQGSGRVAFDGRLDLRVVAAPLADWKDQMKRTKIPIFSDVAGEVLGGLQAMINAAGRTLLYEFKATGTVKEPKLETVPAPVLTEGVARLFGAMLKGERLGEAVGDGYGGETRRQR
jgi:hypothetical protein